MARFLDQQEYINKFKNYNRSLKVRVLIDWFNFEDDGEEGGIDDTWFVQNEDNIDRIDINRDIEGTTGTSVRDRGTIVLKDTDGNFRRNYIDGDYYEGDWNYVEPLKFAKIQVSLDGEDWLDYFTGLVTDITTSRLDDNVVLDLDDPMIILQELSVQDIEGDGGDFHFEIQSDNSVRGKKISEILLGKENEDSDRGLLTDLPLLGVDEESFRKLNDRIIYNFSGMNVFEALQMMLQMSHAYIYTKDFTLYVDSKMFITEEPTPVIETFSDSEDNDKVENIFELEENLSEQRLYNDIRINYSPFDAEQSRQVVWTGGEEETDQSELYYGSDIENRELTLTHDLKDYEHRIQEGEPTRNVPIVPNSVAVIFADKHYTDQDDELIIDYDEGVITFAEGLELPNENEQLEVLYRYYFNQIEPGKTREFYARLEHPVVDIEDIEENLYARSLERIDLESEFGTIVESEKTSFMEEYLDLDAGWFSDSTESGTTYPTSINTIHPSAEKISVTVKASARARSSWFNRSKSHNYQIYLVIDGTRVTRVLNYSGSGNSTKTGHTTYNISENQQGKEFWLEYDAYIDGSNSSNYFKIHSSSNATISYRSADVPDDFDEDDFDLSSQMSVDQHLYEDRQTVWVSITNNTHHESEGYRVELASKVYGQREDTIVILGRPIIQSQSYTAGEISEPSIEHYNTRRKYEITNDLFREDIQADRLTNFLLHQYALPRSLMDLKIQCYPHIELLDRIQLQEKYRDLLEDFLIVGIEDTYQDGSWTQRVTIEEFDDSWEFDEDWSSSPSFPSKGQQDKIREPQPVSNINAYVQEIMTSNDGTFNARLFAEWDNPDTVFHSRVEVYIKRNNEEWRYLGDTSQDNFEENLVPADTYELVLISVNQGGERNSFNTSPTISLDVIQKDAPAPLEFVPEKMEWKDDYLKLAWNPHPDKDFEEYEIRTDLNFGVES